MKRRLEIARALIGWPRIMLFDEPTMSLDPLAALKVLNLIIRARDINKISSLYVTKKIYEIPYLANFCAMPRANGEPEIIEASPTSLPKTRVIVLQEGRIVFDGSADHHEHSKDPYFPNPWDKRRRPAETIL
jgi:ABC-type multidrug transport system ATPase subunit